LNRGFATSSSLGWMIQKIGSFDSGNRFQSET